MSEVPHCPHCKRADRVTVRDGSGYSYYCNNCHKVIEADEITDAAFIDMTSSSMYDDYDAVLKNAEHQYSEKCECNWCERGRPL